MPGVEGEPPESRASAGFALRSISVPRGLWSLPASDMDLPPGCHDMHRRQVCVDFQDNSFNLLKNIQSGLISSIIANCYVEFKRELRTVHKKAGAAPSYSARLTLLLTYLFRTRYFTRCGVKSFPNFSFIAVS